MKTLELYYHKDISFTLSSKMMLYYLKCHLNNNTVEKNIKNTTSSFLFFLKKSALKTKKDHWYLLFNNSAN